MFTIEVKNSRVWENKLSLIYETFYAIYVIQAHIIRPNVKLNHLRADRTQKLEFAKSGQKPVALGPQKVLSHWLDTQYEHTQKPDNESLRLNESNMSINELPSYENYFNWHY